MDHAEEQAGEMEALESIYEGEMEGESIQNKSVGHFHVCMYNVCLFCV